MPTTDSFDFAPIDLMQRDELAAEILNRPKLVVVVWQDDDGRLRIMQSFFTKSDPRSKDPKTIRSLLHQLAEAFDDGSEYHPAELCEV